MGREKEIGRRGQAAEPGMEKKTEGKGQEEDEAAEEEGGRGPCQAGTRSPLAAPRSPGTRTRCSSSMHKEGRELSPQQRGGHHKAQRDGLPQRRLF